MSHPRVTQTFVTDEPEIDVKATDYQGKENELSSENGQALDPNVLIPCAATASIFLYAQGTSIVCCHHDTLAIERTFSNHTDEVILLAVDNHSKAGGGRLVVSCDAGQVAIVWDLLTGDEIARFPFYEPLTAAVWMRNGNIALGMYKPIEECLHVILNLWPR
jgi:WD40 repeat protein